MWLPDRQTDAGQSDPYVPLCFAGDTKMITYDILNTILCKIQWWHLSNHRWYKCSENIYLLYIQLSFSVYLTCKWKGAVSYDTLPGTGFTGSGTIFSLVTTAGKFNRERLFWSLYEVSSNFTADMLFCFVSPSLCKFYNSGSTKQIWFSLPDSSLEHSNSWPTQHSCQESVRPNKKVCVFPVTCPKKLG